MMQHVACNMLPATQMNYSNLLVVYEFIGIILILISIACNMLHCVFLYVGNTTKTYSISIWP